MYRYCTFQCVLQLQTVSSTVLQVYIGVTSYRADYYIHDIIQAFENADLKNFPVLPNGASAAFLGKKGDPDFGRVEWVPNTWGPTQIATKLKPFPQGKHRPSCLHMIVACGYKNSEFVGFIIHFRHSKAESFVLT